MKNKKSGIEVRRNNHDSFSVIKVHNPGKDSLTEKCPEIIKSRILDKPRQWQLWHTNNPEPTAMWQRGFAMSLLNWNPELNLLKPGETTILTNHVESKETERIWKLFILGPGYHRDWWNHLDEHPVETPPNQLWAISQLPLPASNQPNIHCILNGNSALIYNNTMPDQGLTDWAKHHIRDITQWMIEGAAQLEFELFMKVASLEYPKGLSYRDVFIETTSKPMPEIFAENNPSRIAKLMEASQTTCNEWLDWFEKQYDTATQGQITKMKTALCLKSHLPGGIPRDGWWTEMFFDIIMEENRADVFIHKLSHKEKEKLPKIQPWMWGHKYLSRIENKINADTLTYLSHFRHNNAQGAFIRWTCMFRGNNPEAYKSVAYWHGYPSAQNMLVKSIHGEIKRHPEMEWASILTNIQQAVQKYHKWGKDGLAEFQAACERFLPKELTK